MALKFDGSLDKSSAQDMRIWVVDTYMGVKSVVYTHDQDHKSPF